MKEKKVTNKKYINRVTFVTFLKKVNLVTCNCPQGEVTCN